MDGPEPLAAMNPKTKPAGLTQVAINRSGDLQLLGRGSEMTSFSHSHSNKNMQWERRPGLAHHGLSASGSDPAPAIPPRC